MSSREFAGLRKLPFGSILANAVGLIFGNWALVVSAAGALVAALSGAEHFLQRPAVGIGIGVFLALLWTIIGVLSLWDRNRPRLVRSHHDYRYGLTFEGIIPNFDPANDEAMLQFGIQLRNFSAGPMRCKVEYFDVRIGTRALPQWDRGEPPYLPRGAGRTANAVPFGKRDIKEFFGMRAIGTATFAMIYGHPESDYERRLRIKLDINLVFKQDGAPPLGFAANIAEETDDLFH
jgi:hypothetical protein